MDRERVRTRARCGALTRFCISGASPEDQETVAAWVSRGACEDDRDLRMLCVELMASHLRTGLMTRERVMQVLQQLYDFAIRPDSPPQAVPAPRRSENRPARVRRAVT